MAKTLTSRELQVLKLIASGKANRAISESLSISVRTVEEYRGRVMMKINAKSVVDLVRYALREKLIDP